MAGTADPQHHQSLAFAAAAALGPLVRVLLAPHHHSPKVDCGIAHVVVALLGLLDLDLAAEQSGDVGRRRGGQR